MAELRISDAPAAAGRRVEVMWQDGTARRLAVAELAASTGTGGDGRDQERLRWYLEDYAEFPADPGPVLAAEAEARLAAAGGELFNSVFGSGDAAGIWERVRDQLGQVRVEVEADPGVGPGLAWELLRDPAADVPVALRAGAFVRTHLQPTFHAELPDPAGDRLRVLLVICRPGRGDDVPFRSVASRLVRGGAEQMERLDLDVLRPATFARLAQVLRAAHAAGRPYHVVHFDGHGTFADLSADDAGEDGADGDVSGAVPVSPYWYGVSVAGPVRPGAHGYLLFEKPDSESNQQLVDGPTLGRLLAETGVPVLVLNACRSAYAEARDAVAERVDVAAADAADAAVGNDVHSRIRAYGSLAAEVADAGVPGVVAMRYNVYVVTAAQFVADLYAYLLAGRSLGEAAGEARRALAADPVRQIGAVPVSLQDWVVPMVYEAAPVVLLRPPEPDVPLIRLDMAESAGSVGLAGVPGPPDAGFFGRDETLLALDRAFDRHPVLLLHAFAGAGKPSTAAELARWYRTTGGLDDPHWGVGPVFWSSFEHHLTADRVIGMAGDAFAGTMEASGIQWAAITDPVKRRAIVLQVLAQIPVLWVWDNVEPVAGFPAGTASAWSAAEQAELVGLLGDLAERTKCKVLVTSRRDEHGWLSDLPRRVRLPGMPLRESQQLAAAVAERYGGSLAGADWRPLLRYAAGNPLTVTVVVRQAIREGVTSSTGVQAFAERLTAGETGLEPGEDTALGRTRSLAAALSYGFSEAFSETERAQLAVLHQFRDTVDVDALRLMGPGAAQPDVVPSLAGLEREGAIGLLDRAAGIGLLEVIGNGYYQIHPAVPWYFTSLFSKAVGPVGSVAANQAARAYATAFGALGDFYHNRADAGREAQILGTLAAEESNLRHALDVARSNSQWDAVLGCMQGLRILYERTGRDSEWARLVEGAVSDFTDPATGGPLPGKEEHWGIVLGYNSRIALARRDWPTLTALQDARIAWNRDVAAEGLEMPAENLDDAHRRRIRSLAVSLHDLGNMLLEQQDPGCIEPFDEALALFRRASDRQAEAELAVSLGSAHLGVPKLRDLDQAERWYKHSLSLRPEADHLGRAKCLGSLGAVALAKFDRDAAAGVADQILDEHLNAALRGYEDALDLFPPDDHQNRAIAENQLGGTYRRAADLGNALRHYLLSVRHEEARGNIYGAGQTRYNVALTLGRDGRTAEALHYARAAVDNFSQTGPGAATDMAAAEQLVTEIEALASRRRPR